MLRSLALASLGLLAGCSRSEPSSGTSATATQVHAITPAAHDTFKARCAPCHGETGHGDGPAVAKLPTKPPNFADAAWQKSVTDEEISKAIVYGGPAVGKSPAMPAVRDLEAKPELDEILALVRSFKGT
jgi:mono/diheme cytochrome c family protein